MGVYVPYDPDQETFINNFYVRFPSGIGTYPQGLSRATFANRWGTKNSENYRAYFDSQEEFEEFTSKYSDWYLSETPEQFFAEIDRTVAEVGLTLEDIMVKIQSTKTDESNLQVCLLRDEYLKPVYVELRKKGYNKAELWG